MNATGKQYKLDYNISVWDEYQLNYWAIPKCANTAIKVALSRFDANPNKPGSKVKWVHNPDNVNYVSRDMALNNGYKNFTVIRHPYDRVISLYKDFGIRRPWFSPNIAIDDFIMRAQNKQDPHTRSMSNYLFKQDQLLVDDVVLLDNAQDYLKQYKLTLNVFNTTGPTDIVLTDLQKELIYNWYREDFKRFGFDE